MSLAQVLVFGFASGVFGGAMYVHLTDWIIRYRIAKRARLEREKEEQ